ncbi:MAG: response regulator [Myxococcota bacterium]
MDIRVMVVDDSRTIRRQLGRALTKEGFEVIEAEDGEDALEKLRDGPLPDVLISDVNMPNMNGIELLEQIAETPSWSDLPVVMLTTEGDPKVVKYARKLGAKGWLVKPCRPPLLLDVVRQLCGAVAS